MNRLTNYPRKFRKTSYAIFGDACLVHVALQEGQLVPGIVFGAGRTLGKKAIKQTIALRRMATGFLRTAICHQQSALTHELSDRGYGLRHAHIKQCMIMHGRFSHFLTSLSFPPPAVTSKDKNAPACRAHTLLDLILGQYVAVCTPANDLRKQLKNPREQTSASKTYRSKLFRSQDSRSKGSRKCLYEFSCISFAVAGLPFCEQPA